MYSFHTEFLSRRGWKRFDELFESDELAFDGGGVGLNWLSKGAANFRYYNFKVPLYECQVGKSGKFCVASDVSLRFFRETSKGVHEVYYDLRDIVEKLQRQDYMPGYIRGTLRKESRSESGLNSLSVFFASVFGNIHKVGEDGSLYFAISRGLSKERILRFLFDSGVRSEDISLADNNTKIRVVGYAYEQFVRGVMSRPDLLRCVLEEMLNYSNGRGKSCIKVLRFYCPRLADLAQLSMCFSGYNSKVIFDSVQKGRDWALIIEPSEKSISFRNRVIVLSLDSESICLSEPHPVTRYDGRIAML